MEEAARNILAGQIDLIEKHLVSLELKALRLRQQARSLDKAADDVDVEMSAYLTTKNTLQAIAAQAAEENKDA